MESLTGRAERAVLGAMISDPGLAGRLEYLQAGDFADWRHRAVFTAILLAAGEPGMTADRWHSAIPAHASPQVSAQLIGDLPGACPVVAHGAAYGALVVEGSVHRQLAGRGRVLASRGEELAESAERAIAAGASGGTQAAELASHMKQLGEAFTRHPALIVTASGQPGYVQQEAAVPMPDDLGAGRQAREDGLLTALLQRHPESSRVLDFLPVGAFADPYRQELFHAIRSLHSAGKPVDPLTADWELARRGIPPVSGTESYATRLARADADAESPVKTASILLTRLCRRTSRALTHGVQLFPEPAQAKISAPRHSGSHLQLVQPPPGPTALGNGPEPRK